MDDYKQISARVPEEIHQALEWLMDHLEMSKAQAIRYAIIEACQQHGRIVEDTMPQWGGTRETDNDTPEQKPRRFVRGAHIKYKGNKSTPPPNNNTVGNTHGCSTYSPQNKTPSGNLGR